jgi:hypothetical protein
MPSSRIVLYALCAKHIANFPLITTMMMMMILLLLLLLLLLLIIIIIIIIIETKIDLSTQLSAKNKVEAIGSLAVPVLRYSFGIINWHQKEIQKLDRKTRKMLTIHGQHQTRADIDRLYVPRKEGGEDNAGGRSLHSRN